MSDAQAEHDRMVGIWNNGPLAVNSLIAEAAARYSLTQNPMTAETQQAIADDFAAGYRAALAARQVPEDVAALVAEAREHNVWEGSHDDLRDLLDRLAAALEVSSRTVAPNREASIETIRQVILSKSWSREKGAASTVAWLGLATEVFDALLAADLWQPAPVIDRDALAKFYDDAFNDGVDAVAGVGVPGSTERLGRRNGAVDALLASGWQPASPRTVATVEELDALPVGSVILMQDTKGPFLRTAERWESTRFPGKPVYDYTSDPERLPASVLYVPSEGVES